jgi:hypothetical protein
VNKGAVLDARDLCFSISLGEEEERFLCGCIRAAVTRGVATTGQLEIALRITNKVMLARDAKYQELIDRFGADAVAAVREKSLADSPSIGEV